MKPNDHWTAIVVYMKNIKHQNSLLLKSTMIIMQGTRSIYGRELSTITIQLLQVSSAKLQF